MYKTVQLKDIISVIRNGLNTTQYDEPVHDKMLPISRIETISDGTISMARVKYAEVTSSQREKYLLREGDILFSHINSPAHIGKTGIVENECHLLHGVNLLLLRPKLAKCYPPYLNYYLKTPPVRTIFRTRFSTRHEN